MRQTFVAATLGTDAQRHPVGWRRIEGRGVFSPVDRAGPPLVTAGVPTIILSPNLECSTVTVKGATYINNVVTKKRRKTLY